MTISKWPFGTTDQVYFTEIEKDSFQADRMVQGFPLADIYRVSYEDADEISGDTGTRTPVKLFSGLQISVMPADERRIEQSGGAIQPGATDIVVYDTGGTLRVNDFLRLPDGRQYRIYTLTYFDYSDRYELVCNPFSMAGAI